MKFYTPLLASQFVDGGTIALMLLLLIAIITACAALIYGSFWLTNQVNGSQRLVWGAMLVAAALNFRPLLGLLFGAWGHVSFLYESLLPGVTVAAILACATNVALSKRRAKAKPNNATQATENTS